MKYKMKLHLIVFSVLLNFSVTQEECSPCKCTNNKIDCSSKSVKRRVTELPRLDLDTNTEDISWEGQPLEIISGKTFRNLSNLKIVNLQNCQLTFIYNDTFKYISELIELNLSYNKLDILDQNTFEHNNKLETIRLNDNKLQTIDGSMFSNQVMLINLYLQNNVIYSITKDAFPNYPSLKMLNLSKNKLKYLDANILVHSVDLQELYLNGNPFNCDCNLKPLFEVIDKSKLNINPLCAEPKKIENESFLGLRANDFTCPINISSSLNSTNILTYIESTTLPCIIQANATPYVEWKFNNNKIYEENNENYHIKRVQLNSTSLQYDLTLFNLLQNNSGQYTCIAKNTGFSNTIQYNLTVKSAVKPKILMPDPQDRYIFVDSIDDNYTIPFKVFGIPKPKVTWIYRGKILTSNSESYYKSISFSESVVEDDTYWFNLTIRKVTLDYNIGFTCRISNFKGTTNKTVSLKIMYPQNVVFERITNKYRETYEMNNITLACVLKAVPKPDINWRYGHLKIDSNISPNKYVIKEFRDNTGTYWSKLTISQIEMSDAGKYRCEANNSKTIKTQKFIVTVEQIIKERRTANFGTTIFIAIGCILLIILFLIVIFKCCLRYYVSKNWTQDVTTSVEVHFENKDGGFFLKHTPKQHFQPIPDLSSVLPSSSTPSSVLSVDRFTVFQSSQPISVRATYGPFSTKQTVPARYIVPDPLDNLPPLPLPPPGEHNATGAATTGVELQELVTHHLDMSAHIVRPEIPRDSPVLRVLFHTGADPGGRRQLLLARHQRVCIVLHATTAGRAPLSAACSPDGEDGVCLAQVTIPSNWWPPLPPPDKHGRPGKPVKTPPRLVQVAYSVLEPRPADGEGCLPRIQIQPVTVLGFVPLVPAKAAYKELRVAEIVTMLVPHPPLFPLSRFHIPVFMERERAKELTAVVIRARVKSGLRILSATPSTDQWNITVEINPKHTGASVTALRREPQEPDQAPPPTAGEVAELFSWLVEVTEGAEESYEGAKVVWSARFEPHAPESHHRSHGSGGSNGANAENRKPTTKLEVQKDDIQAVVPISKNWEVMNTAVLTNRQVSQAMKVFIVSQAGKAADVTLQSSCHSEDESVLKVSSSCSSVYVDGSELRGSVNGSVLVKYATYTGLARFTVWMPEFPLDLTVPDVRLSQIKSWKVPDYHPNVGKVKRRKRSFGGWGPSMLPEDFSNGVGNERPLCRLRYQQSPVDVYAHFVANDHDSGRVTYFVNRRTWLRVTDLVLPLLRVSDPRIASLHGRILQGRSMGRTEVQVLSPITGRVIGAKEVRVGNDKVFISKLSVRVVSGLQLNISPDSSIENGYIAETSVTRRLTAQYQEGLLDIELEFNDGSKTPLRDIADADYHLVVKSLDTEVVAFAPMVASHHPRVIAVGEGNGDLLQVSLLLNEDCRIPTRPKLSGKSPGPLATAAAEVEVDFSVSEIPHRPDFVQNDGGMPLKDENNHEPTVQARQHHSLQNGVLSNHGRGVTRYQQPANMTPLEIGMYVLLTAFCFAIVVFVVSCVVYASKFKPQGMDAQLGNGNGTAAVPSLGRSTLGMGTGLGIMREPRKPRESTTNAHDWVWLGRATLERSSGMMQTSGRSSTINNNNSAATEMRITTNPMSLNYSEPDDCIIQATSFDNPHHIELPSRHIDSATYCKKDRTNNNGQTHPGNNNNNNNNNAHSLGIANSTKDTQDWDEDVPPPLPPHAVPLQPDASNEDYKPPVPPHRNIGVTARISPSSGTPPIVPPPRKHHHHHHHRNSKHQAVIEPKKSAFEFDDTEPSSDFDHEIFQLAQQKGDKVNLRHKNKNDNDDNVEFVQFPKNADGNSNGIIRGNSPEVKRATIIGNPMFSASADVDAETQQSSDTGTTPADLSALDDLQLDMDYDQIMHYFDNLKESNA